jgi:hypothetical protein
VENWDTLTNASYSIIAPTGDNGTILWTSPTAPGCEPEFLYQGTVAQLSTVRHSWEEAFLTYCTFNTVQQALKKQIITVFEPMYLDIVNEYMVGFANITAREMLDHLFITYGNITAIDLENNFEQMRKAWDPNIQWKPCSSKFKIVLTSRMQEE